MPTIRIHDRIQRIPAEQWDALNHGGSPFSDHAWLSALEETGCAVEDEGWIPRHVTVEDDEGRLLAGAPTYIKLHSMGEFVYDWSWAHAARQLGERYYPKIIVGVPFTPATGGRLLTRPGEDRARLVELLIAGLHELARLTDAAGIHVLFNTAEEVELLEGLGAHTRLQFQFHWTDEGYGDFDGFLAAFQSKKRKSIRRERRLVADQGLSLQVLEGADLEAHHLDTMQDFYLKTCMQFGGHGYLKPAFWDAALANLADRLHLILAYEDGAPVAGAFSVRGRDRLYGRYWGAAVDRNALHFEVCYYAPVDYCLQQGLSVFEPGHGGGHKYVRGFEPAICTSSHWLRSPRLAKPIAAYLEQERAEVLARVEALLEESPLRRK